MLTPELRHASALPDLPTYLTCPAFAVLCPPSVSCSRLIGPRSYPCLCPAPSTPAKRPKWPSEPALIARLLPIPFDAVAWHHPTTLDAESLSAIRAHFAGLWNNGNNHMILRTAGASGPAWPHWARRVSSWEPQTSFCVSPQSLVTCLLAGTPYQSERMLFPGAGTFHGAACWLISN